MPITFLTLPRELRDEINQLSLNSQDVIYPHGTECLEELGIVPYNKCNQKVAVGLLGTSKKSRGEAMPFLFGENAWAISNSNHLIENMNVSFINSV